MDNKCIFLFCFHLCTILYINMFFNSFLASRRLRVSIPCWSCLSHVDAVKRKSTYSYWLCLGLSGPRRNQPSSCCADWSLLMLNRTWGKARDVMLSNDSKIKCQSKAAAETMIETFIRRVGNSLWLTLQQANVKPWGLKWHLTHQGWGYISGLRSQNKSRCNYSNTNN